ncbi:MAG: HIT family protein [Nanoarchaeota archaeon]
MSNGEEQGSQACIFCQIAKGNVESKKIYEDEKILAVLDIYPANPGHILVMPKEHYSLMMQMPDSDVGHMFSVIKKLSNVILKGLEVNGTNIYLANGSAAGQKAPHFMVHIIPRKENDGLNFTLTSGQQDDVALDKLRSSLVPLIKETFGLTQEKVNEFYQLDANSKDLNQEPKKNTQIPKDAKNQSYEEGSKNTFDESDNIDLDKIGNIFK